MDGEIIPPVSILKKSRPKDAINRNIKRKAVVIVEGEDGGDIPPTVVSYTDSEDSALCLTSEDTYSETSDCPGTQDHQDNAPAPGTNYINLVRIVIFN